MAGTRRHRCQMETPEINSWESMVNRARKWHMGPYATNRATQRGITYGEVLETLRRGYLVEVSRGGSLCLVVRKEFIDYSVCVVVAPCTRFIITTWKNDPFDTHESLDLSKYQLPGKMTYLKGAYVRS